MAEWKKKTVPIVDIKEMKSVEVKLLGIRKVKDIEETNKETGEVTTKTLSACLFEDLKTKNKFQSFLDGGLKNALEQAEVKDGDEIKIDFLGLVPMKGKNAGKSVNTYEIYTR